MARIYKMNDEAWNAGMTWDSAIYNDMLETVAEFDTVAAAVDYFENELGADSERYGVE